MMQNLQHSIDLNYWHTC